jgi:hypothetical protein
MPIRRPVALVQHKPRKPASVVPAPVVLKRQDRLSLPSFAFLFEE